MMRVVFAAYCGMLTVPACFDTRQEGRDYVARTIRHTRARGYKIVITSRGKSWEVLEPIDCAMVPDACGELRMTHVTFECRECGCDCETVADALHCCAEYEHDSFEDCYEVED